MNKTFKKIITNVAVAASIFTGTIIAAPIATAAPAQAVTLSSCYSYYEWGWRYTQVCWHDFNWWEESWMGGGYRDGWYRTTRTSGA